MEQKRDGQKLVTRKWIPNRSDQKLVSRNRTKIGLVKNWSHGNSNVQKPKGNWYKTGPRLAVWKWCQKKLVKNWYAVIGVQKNWSPHGIISSDPPKNCSSMGTPAVTTHNDKLKESVGLIRSFQNQWPCAGLRAP